jgi:hypothetical protein
MYAEGGKVTAAVTSPLDLLQAAQQERSSE